MQRNSTKYYQPLSIIRVRQYSDISLIHVFSCNSNVRVILSPNGSWYINAKNLVVMFTITKWSHTLRVSLLLAMSPDVKRNEVSRGRKLTEDRKFTIQQSGQPYSRDHAYLYRKTIMQPQRKYIHCFIVIVKLTGLSRRGLQR